MAEEQARAAATTVAADATRQALIATIAKSFSDEEMAGLLSDLGVAAEINQNAAVTEQARLLVDYFLRRKRVGELVETLQVERPLVQWPNLENKRGE
ncbi:MAG: hypothetical protein H6658_02025 [Ardenticatenaceae bacterium]|nr:hypothetical protein [Ardenticatenaceae bacterium]